MLLVLDVTAGDGQPGLLSAQLEVSAGHLRYGDLGVPRAGHRTLQCCPPRRRDAYTVDRILVISPYL